MNHEFSVSGITFAVKDDPSLATARPSGWASVVLDKSNPFAKHPAGAFELRWGAQKIGYLPDKHRAVQDKMLLMLKAGEKPCVEITEYGYMDEDGRFNDDERGELHQITCVFREHQDSDLGPYTPLRSFNEGVVVDFYDRPHVYMYQGKRLTSGTQLVKKAYKPFDGEGIAARIADKWEMSQEDILAMWKMNGDVSSSFGTSVHMAMEMLTKFAERGKPKMPVLRAIVESFPGEMGENVRSEVLLSCVAAGVCGQCDRLVKHGDVYTVEDYKCNIDFEQKESRYKNSMFPDLPRNKFGKTVMQLSIYCDMLERAGMKVSDEVTAWVWDGEWNKLTETRIAGVLDKMKEEKK